MSYYPEHEDRLATEAEAHAEYVRNVGAEHPDQAWILSDFDSWGKNPYYHGPVVPHPEDDEAYEYIEEHGIEAWRNLSNAPAKPKSYADDEIPF